MVCRFRLVAWSFGGGFRIDSPRDGVRAALILFGATLFLFASLGSASAEESEQSEDDAATRSLLRAADKGDVGGIQAALAEGARINESSMAFAGPDRQPPLVAAALRGHADAVRLLLEAGADPLLGERDGFNVWHAAAFQGWPDVLKVLIEEKTPGYGPHEDGFTPLHRAGWGQRARHTECVELLVREGGRACDEANAKGRKALALTKNPRTAKFLRACLAAEPPARHDAKGKDGESRAHAR